VDNIKLTADIRPQWEPIGEELLKVLRRLQSAAKTGGCAVIKIAIAVDADGVPHCWTSPQVIKLEPRASCTQDFLDAEIVHALIE